MLSKLTFTPAVGSAIDLHASSGSYKVSRAEGIVGPPAPRDVLKVAPGRDGSLDDTRMVSHRDIVIEGEIIGTSQTDVWTKWDALAAAFQSTMLSRGTLTVTLPDGTTQRQISVVLSGAAQPSFEGGSAFLQYQVNLRAPDPRWLGTTVNSSALGISSSAAATSSTNTVTSAGTAPALPTFTWTGGTGTGRLVDKVTVNVPSAYSSIAPGGSALILDDSPTATPLAGGETVNTSTRISTLAGLSATTEWPALYPGSSTWNWSIQTSSGSGGTTTCTMTWRDAWW